MRQLGQMSLQFLCISICIATLLAASAHKHSHTNKERAEDGAFSPRDHEHFDEEGEFSQCEQEEQQQLVNYIKQKLKTNLIANSPHGSLI